MPNESTVRSLIIKIEIKFTLLDQKIIVRCHPCQLLENIVIVWESDAENSETSMRNRDHELNISKSTYYATKIGKISVLARV